MTYVCGGKGLVNLVIFRDFLRLLSCLVPELGQLPCRIPKKSKNNQKAFRKNIILGTKFWGRHNENEDQSRSFCTEGEWGRKGMNTYSDCFFYAK